jgi:membrane protein involved in colicin uptake
MSGLFMIIFKVIYDLVAECKDRNKKQREAANKENEDTKYKKWKKRRQLVKRENALREKQKLLDQHEDLVNQYRKQQEEELAKKRKEEKERKRKEREAEEAAAEYDGEEEGAPDNGYGDESKAWQQDQSAYMMNDATVYGYNAQMVEDQMMYAKRTAKRG